MRRVSPVEPSGPCILAERPINHIRMQVPPCFKTFTIVTHGPEQWPCNILAVFGEVEIITNALRGLRVNGETPLLAAFAHDLQRIEAAVHVEVSDFQARDFGTAKPDLQTNRKN